MLTHKAFKAKALSRPEVRAEYDRLEGEFTLLDEFLRARASAGLTQAEVAERIGTTQSAIARLETGGGRHKPSLATLQRYAEAVGCRLELRLVKQPVEAKQTTAKYGRSAERKVSQRKS